MSFFKKISSSLMGKPHEPEVKPLIVTGRVVRIEKHPNADRLRIVHVDIGSTEVGPVVCGATNFSEQDIVALALPGAHISHNIHSDAHESYELDKATIRGVESQGMICSGFEIGLRETPETREEGILVFPVGTKLGVSVDSISR